MRTSSRGNLGRWGDLTVEAGGVSIGPLAMLILGLVIAAVALIFVGNGANQVWHAINFQTGQPASSPGDSLIGWGDGILILLSSMAVIGIAVWVWVQSNGGSGY